jgi:L-amino acid N-acyltransferase YncA
MSVVGLRLSTPSDSGLIWQWRNSVDVRNFSRNQAPIPRASHDEWFARRIENLVSQPFWVVQHDNRPVGYIRFDSVSALDFETSLVIDRESRGKGIGTKALHKAVAEFTKQFNEYGLLARVSTENGSSLNLFRSCGFDEILSENGFITLRYEFSNYIRNSI